jgi:hypothetical protein
MLRIKRSRYGMEKDTGAKVDTPSFFGVFHISIGFARIVW